MAYTPSSSFAFAAGSYTPAATFNFTLTGDVNTGALAGIGQLAAITIGADGSKAKLPI